jgi:hypothetical protein
MKKIKDRIEMSEKPSHATSLQRGDNQCFVVYLSLWERGRRWISLAVQRVPFPLINSPVI